MAQSVSESDWELVDVVIQGVLLADELKGDGGTSLAPARLRALSRASWAVTECGQLIDRIRLVDVGDIHIGKERGVFHRFLSQRIAAFPRSAFLIHLGGDHSISIPLVEGFGLREKGSCGVLLLDAHADLSDADERDRFGPACVLRRILEFSFLSPKKVILVGVRSFTPGEVEFLQRCNMSFIHARDFQLRGWERSAQQVIEALYEFDSVYLSIDMDVFDPAYAPAATLRVPAGLTSREVLSFLRVVFGKLNISAMDLVEILPSQDPLDVTSSLGVRIVLEALGLLQARKGRLAL
ncbi:MAG: arginase family protein [Acidobacteria bacterium]|nr:arginase family protein [Acidobacteriota bacterium]